LQQVGHADAGLGQHPTETVAKIGLVFEFGFDVNDCGGLVFRFRGVLRNFSLFPNEVEESVQVWRRDSSGDVSRRGQYRRFIRDARREHLALKGPAKRDHRLDRFC